jgi:anti-sigma B factor antagonist
VPSTEAPTLVPFAVQHDLRDGFARLFVCGELDLFTARLLEDELASVERWIDRVVVDLSDLSFMDASGLRALAGAARRASERGLRFAITGCRPMVRRVFELTGMGGMLDEAVPELLGAHAGG